MLREKDRKMLIEQAVSVREKSYSPYSNYKVGAAILAGSGKIVEYILSEILPSSFSRSHLENQI